MTTTFKVPTQGRLQSTFLALGPYLRKLKTEENCYFFDSLGVCLDVEAEPDKREFWGWWFKLTVEESGCTAHYKFGLYDLDGEWQPKKVPKEHHAELQTLLDEFIEKLAESLKSNFDLDITVKKTAV
ncbi:sigma factor-binding protein Crl [Aliivibrio kagoshimensis]|uniref:sigma factor-binding protein Crl n=1 Tax=Aliivibrio kagoshimensis TaxID=2910230 RepID=UPI003D12CBC4